MTTIVRKGANRGSHNARTAKAAQRTPLPPKGATSGAGKATTARAIAELHTELKEKKENKASAINNNSGGKKATGMSKAEELVRLAKEAGWDTKVEMPVENEVVATLTRGDEEITVTWINGVITAQAIPVYLVGTRQVKLRNVSAVRKQLSADPEERPIKETKPRAARLPRQRNADGNLPPNTPRRRVPFDVDAATDEEIRVAVTGRRIKWRNMMAGGKLEEGWISKDAKVLKIEQHPHRPTRTLTFCDTKGGYRSVALDRLLVVGK